MIADGPHNSLVEPLKRMIDDLAVDPVSREQARHDLNRILSCSSARRSSDAWSRTARPMFLYVMYALILWAFPMGIVAAMSPRIAQAITRGMTAYLTALPEPLYALFGTGYLGYATLRQWGKVKGAER